VKYQRFFIIMKEILLKLDDTIVSRLEEEIKKKRVSGVCNAFSDIILVRLLESMAKENKMISFKLQSNKLIVRNNDKPIDSVPKSS